MNIQFNSIQVGNRDTLTSLAARFDTTPGELTSINKLNSSFIYPGQSLLVPDKTASSGENISDEGSDVTTQESLEKARKLSTDEVQNEKKERGKFNVNYCRNHKIQIMCNKKRFFFQFMRPKLYNPVAFHVIQFHFARLTHIRIAKRSFVRLFIQSIAIERNVDRLHFAGEAASAPILNSTPQRNNAYT